MTNYYKVGKDDKAIAAQLTALIDKKDDAVIQAVKKIIADVQQEGDKALLRYTKQFDRHEQIEVSAQEIKAAEAQCAPDIKKALAKAAERIASYHQKQLPADLDYVDEQGVRLGNVWRPIDSVGLYVPGGLASYPSSVLMNAVPAKIAGVSRLTMVVPAPDNQLNPAILVAAKMAGVDAIYKVGGAQAIAALAFGTKRITKVDKIIGPGNQYVAEAKRQVFGMVGIDMIAGPSEVLIVSDRQTPAEWVATDLLAQAEHDANARSILLTDDAAWADQVMKAVEHQLETLPRADIARKSWQQNGMVIVLKALDDAIDYINRIAPEHLQLALDEAQITRWLPHLKHAGAIFIGRYTPEAIGDYIAGPSHVLPTSGTARFSSGLSVYDFLKRVSLIGCSAAAFQQLAKATNDLAVEEGLHAHATSITLRQVS